MTKIKPLPFSKQLLVCLPIEAKNTTVLGYGAWSSGAKMWQELDWTAAHTEGTCDGTWQYLHVRVKWDSKEDGWHEGKKAHRWYRVRCRYEPGMKYRGREIQSVQVHVVVQGRNVEWVWRLNFVEAGR